MSGNWILCYDARAGKPSAGSEKFSVTMPFLMSGRLITQITIPLIIMHWVWLSERPTKPHA